MDEEIGRSLQRYQSIVLLDLLIEFREEFVRRIISRWLRAVFMPDSYLRQRYEENIKSYFGRPNLAATLIKDFSEWRAAMAAEPLGADQTFDSFARELEVTLKEIERDFREYLRLIPAVKTHESVNGGSYSRMPEDDIEDLVSDFQNSNIDRLREFQFTLKDEDKTEARRVGVAVDAFIRTRQFAKRLYPSTPEDVHATYGLLAMFSLVLLTVDYSNPSEISHKDATVERFAGGRFRFVLPPDELLFASARDAGHLQETRYRFQTFFPLITEEVEAKKLETALSEFVRKCGCEVDQSEAFNAEKLVPAIFRGANTVVYDTNYAKSLFCRLTDAKRGDLHEAWTIHRNVNFIQLLPSPSMKLFGYFQMQSPLPGLVRALFPSEEFNDGWNRLRMNGAGEVSVVSLADDPHKDTVLVEVPRDTLVLGDYISEMHRKGDFVLEGIYWIQNQNAVTPWSQRFHNQMVYLDVLRKSLWDTIEPKITKRYQEQVELLRKPLENLTEAVGSLQRDTQELRAVLYDPAKALFASVPALDEIFSEDAVIVVGEELKVMVSHSIKAYEKPDEEHDDRLQPRDRRETKVNGRVILAIALCRIYGCADVMKAARSSKLAILIARQELEVRARMPVFIELTGDLLWLLGCRSLSDAIDGDPTAPLSRLKECLFDPFKLSSKDWLIKQFGLAVLPYVEDRNSLALDWEKRFDMPPGWSPVAIHAALSLVMDVCGEAFSRLEDKRKVRFLVLDAPGDDPPVRAPTRVIKLVFNGPYLKRGQSHGWTALRLLLGQHILVKETRDWRIAEVRAGNFTKPYIDFASRLLGMGTSWTQDTPPAENVLFSVASKDRRFSIRLEPPALHESNTLTLIWEPHDHTSSPRPGD